MPRSIRARLLNPRKKVAAKAPAAAGSDAASMEQLQSVAMNASGRMALGPWLGPYSAVLEDHGAPTSPTLYVHYKGRVFSDLDGSPAPIEEGLLEQPASPRGHGALVAAAMPDVPRQRRDHSKVDGRLGVSDTSQSCAWSVCRGGAPLATTAEAGLEALGMP